MTDLNTAAAPPRRRAPVDRQRSARRFAIALVAVVLTGSLAYIGFKFWVVGGLAERLRTLPVVVEAAPRLGLEVLERRVVGHHGPGKSAYFDLVVVVEVRREPTGRPGVVRLDGALLDGKEQAWRGLRPVEIDALRPGERRVVEIVASPVPRPVIEQAQRLSIRAR